MSFLWDMWENKGEVLGGLLSPFTNPTQEVEKGADWDRDVVAHNIPVDVGNIAQDVKTIVTHPKEAYESATGLIGGAWRTGLEKVMPEGVMDALGKVDEYVGYDSEPDKAMASEAWEGIVATHGGLEELKKYGNEHPVYLAAELSGLGFLARQVTKMVAPAVVKAMEATEMGVSRGLLAVENVAESVESAFPQPLGTQIFAGEVAANRVGKSAELAKAKQPDSALQLGTENKVLEYVGTNEPQKAYLEYVHIDDLIALQGEYGSTYSKEHWTRLKKEIEKEGGLTDPINIQVDRLSRTADVVEGNHRITLAKEMGYEWLPTWVNLQSDFKNIRKNKRSDIIPSIDNETFHPAYDTEGNRRPQHLPSYGRPSRYLSDIRTLPLVNNKTLQGDPLTPIRPKPALEKGLLGDTVVPRLKASDFKRNKDGTYVGFNKSINTPQKITKLLKQLEGLAIEGADARMWYENSSTDIINLVNGDVVEAEKIAQILAITSQGTDVKSNTGFAFKAYAQHKAGLPIEAGRFPKEQAKKIVNVLNGIPWEGRKTNSFYGNLMTQIDPSKVIEGQTTQDMWMARAFGLSRDVPGDAQYKIMEEITQNIAAQNNWTPYQTQAAIWVATKARNESMKSEINAHIKKKKWGKNADTILPQHQQKFNKYFQQMVYDSKFDLTQFTKASYSFADGIQDNLGFINLEAVPSTELVNVLPGIHNALPEQKAEFTKAMYSIFLDENGVDLLAKEIGVVSPDGFMGFGGWDGDINPNMQVQGLLSGTISGGINPADVQLVELYAAVVGTVFKQDGVSYRRAFNDTKVSAQNGVDFDVGRRLTAEEHQKIYDALIKVFGHGGVQPTSTGTGADIIQYRHKDGKFEIDEKGLGFDMPNKEFQKLVEQAIMEVGLEDDIHIGFYRSDGKLVENNWKENPNGEGYEGNTTTKSQSLYRQLVDKYSQEAETIRQEFGDKYGWGEVQKSLITKGLLKTTVKKPPTHLLE